MWFLSGDCSSMSLARDKCTLVAKHTSDTAVSKLDVMMIHWAIVRVLHQVPLLG